MPFPLKMFSLKSYITIFWMFTMFTLFTIPFIDLRSSYHISLWCYILLGSACEYSLYSSRSLWGGTYTPPERLTLLGYAFLRFSLYRWARKLGCSRKHSINEVFTLPCDGYWVIYSPVLACCLDIRLFYIRALSLASLNWNETMTVCCELKKHHNIHCSINWSQIYCPVGYETDCKRHPWLWETSLTMRDIPGYER